MSMPEPEFITIPELALKLRIAERTAYDLVRQGRVPGAAKVGGQWRVRLRDLDAWLDAGGEADRPTEEGP